MPVKKETPQEVYQKERFKLIFEYSPVAIWEEDYSPLLDLKKKLEEKKVDDVDAYLKDHQRLVLATFRKIKVLSVNRAVLELYGAKSKKELLDNLDKTIHKDMIRVLGEEYTALMEGRGEFVSECKTKTLAGKVVNVKMRVAIPTMFKDSFKRAIVTMQDVTTEKKHEKHLEQLAQTDGLTNVLNHNAILDRLRIEMLRAERYSIPLACLMVDLDYFKSINDLCGHQKGDQILKKVAGIITLHLREVDIVGRYGGDEFMIILPQTSKENAQVVGDRLKVLFERLAEESQGGTMYSTISVGIAGLPDRDVKTPKDLISKVDKAMYQAKKDGRNRIVIDE